jgi:tRNA dimethylallyltransferase
VVVGLRAPREELIARLDARAAAMFDNGLVAEVRALIPAGIERGVTASRAIGYSQALAVIHGTMTESEAVAETSALTRRFARRQVSWFSRNSTITWMDAPGRAAAVVELFDAASGSA